MRIKYGTEVYTVAREMADLGSERLQNLPLWLGMADDWRVVDNEAKCPVSGKRKYASEGEAMSTAAHQIATANAPKDLRAYLCPWCDAWHLTKNAGKAGRDRK